MRFTDILKEYVEELMNKARYEANSKARIKYLVRKVRAEEEIKTYLAEVVNPHIEEILKANNMDLTGNRWGYDEPAPKLVLEFCPRYICNKKENEAIYEEQHERQRKQIEAIKKFSHECGDGISKGEFYRKVAKLVKEVK